MFEKPAVSRVLLVSLLCLGACVSVPGCSIVRGGGGSRIATQASHDGTGSELPLNALRAVFVPGQAAIADAYLTDLPPAALEGAVDLSQVQGVLVHAHVLTQPKAGRTPIATSATTASVRLIIVSNGQAGLYAGGGFGDFDVDAKTLTGSLRGASMRLVRATKGFQDVLGPSALTLQVNAKADEPASMQANNAITALIDAMEPVVAD